jgi:tetratricopeptide (TPR) repeat protein
VKLIFNIPVNAYLTALVMLIVSATIIQPVQAQSKEAASHETVQKLFTTADELRYSDPEGAKKIALQAAWLAELSNNKEDILKTQRLLSSIYWLTSQYDSALYTANEALMLSEQLNNAHEKATTLHTIGIIYRALGDPDRAVSQFFESLQIFENLEDKSGISRLFNSIGILFADQDDVDRAKDYYSRSLDISRQLGDLHGIARGLNNLALIENGEGSLERRKQYLAEALKINRQTGQKLWEGINYLNLGEVYLDEEKYDSAYHYYRLSLKHFEQLKNIPQMVSALLYLSEYYERSGDLEHSHVLARRAMHLADSTNVMRSKISAAHRLSQVNNLLGNEMKSLRYSVLSYQLQDSINKEESANRIRMIEMLNDYDRTLQAKKLEQQKRDATYLVIIITIVFMAILAVTIVLARMKINRKNAQMLKKDLESELDNKNKELTISVMSLMKKNEIITNIAKRLNKLNRDRDKEVILSDMRAIIKDLKRSSENEIWEDFDRRFREVHSGFYQQLTKQYPNLTPNELKLCAFMRMNLSSKEISELTGQRVPSIDIARSRLRKKLGIAHSEVNLTNFLSQF